MNVKEVSRLFDDYVLNKIAVVARVFSNHGYEVSKPEKIDDGQWGFILTGATSALVSGYTRAIFEWNDERRLFFHVLVGDESKGSHEVGWTLGNPPKGAVKTLLGRISQSDVTEELFEKTSFNPLNRIRGRGVLDWMPPMERGEVSLGRAPDSSPWEMVKESNFVVELEANVPEYFWDNTERGEDWLERFHMALRKTGWPPENITGVYSYFNNPLEKDSEYPNIIQFNVWLPGDWVSEHPTFLYNLSSIRMRSVSFRDDNFSYKVNVDVNRIVAEEGPLNGAEWHGRGPVAVYILGR